MPRLFVAIDLPAQQRQELVAICRGLPQECRWTPPGQLHLTLCFIGEVDDLQFGLIKKALAEIIFTPFLMQIQGLGGFPSVKHPKILWAGVAENSALRQLQGLIEERLVQLGFSRADRRFHPHLTIARLRSFLPPEILAAYLGKNGRIASAPFRIDCFHLYSSLLSKAGAVHHLEGTYCAK